MNVNKRLAMIFIVVFSLLLTVNVALALPPTAGDASVVMQEDVQYTFKLTDFTDGFNDPDGGEFKSLLVAYLDFDSNNQNAEFQINGVTVEAADEITKEQIENGELTFLNVENENGNGYFMFDFLVKDSDDELGLQIAKMTIDVNPFNDGAPTSSDILLVTEEDLAIEFSEISFVFNDVDPEDELVSLTVVETVTAGTLSVNGVEVVDHTNIPAADLDSLVFLNTLDENGNGYADFTFTVSDGELSSESYTVDINVNAVNDAAPTSEDNTVVATEDVSFPFSAADFAFADLDPEDELVAIGILSTVTKGTLSLDGVAVTDNTGVVVADLSKLTFLNVENENGEDYASFTFQVSDGLASSATYTMTINVNPVNEGTPTSADKAVEATEDVELAFSSADFAFADSDPEDALVSINVVSTVAKGELAVDGVAVVDNTNVPVADLGKLTFLNVENENGVDYTSFTFTVSDGALSSIEHTMSISVTAVNDAAATSADETVSTQEETELTFAVANFAFEDVDPEDSLVSVKIVSTVTAGTLALDGVAVADGVVVPVADLTKLTFVGDVNGQGTPYTSFTFSVNDGTVDSAVYTMEIDVTNTNGNPVLDAVVAQTAFEDEEFSLELTAKDEDGSDVVTTISVANSDLDWLSVADDGMTLEGTPNLANAGDTNISVVVADSEGDLSEAVEFTVTVTKGFEIVQDDTFAIKIADKTHKLSDEVTVFPGDEIDVTFKYKNNMGATFFEKVLNLLMGNVKVEVVSTDVDAQSYNKAAVKSLATATETVSVVVPTENVPAELKFTVKITGQTSFFRTYTDSVDLTFKVEQPKQLIVFQDVDEPVVLVDDTLSCNTFATLKLSLENKAETPAYPVVYVFDAAATVDTENGGMSSTSAVVAEKIVSEVAIAASGTTVQSFTVDLSALTSTKDLHVYLASDFSVDSDGKFLVDDEATVVVEEVTSCLDKLALEDELTLKKNADDTTVDFLTVDSEDALESAFLNEEIANQAGLTFEVVEESNEDLLTCSFTGSMLTCEDVAEEAIGSSELTIKITNGDSELEEKITVKVNPDLGITSLKVNGVDSNTLLDTAVTAKPLDELDIRFKLKNFADEKMQKVSVKLVDNDNADGFAFVFDAEKTFTSISANTETSENQLKVTIPLDAPKGTSKVSFVVTGVTQDDVEFSDAFEFDLTIDPDKASVLVSVALAEGEPTQVTCDSHVNLDVTFKNLGTVSEDDVAITVKDGSTLVFEDKDLSIDSGELTTLLVPVTVEGAVGTHKFDVELSYNFIDEMADDKVTASINVVKNKCLGTATPTDTSLTIGDGVTQDFEVTPAEDVANAKIQWKVVNSDNVEVTSNIGSKFSFATDIVGTYTVSVEVNADVTETQSWTVNVVGKPTDLSAFNVDVTKVDAEGKVIGLVLENSLGKVEYAADSVIDLSEVVNLGESVLIQSGVVGVDSTKVSALNLPATVTLKNVASGATVILKKDTFGTTGEFAVCDTCKPVSHENGNFVFTVDGFSTYKVVIEQSVDLQSSEVSFTDAKFGETVQTTFTLKNLGSIKSMNNIVVVSELALEYNALLTNVPVTLNPLGEATVTLTVTVPADESAGKHRVGDLSVTWEGLETAKKVPVYVNPESFLSIDTIKINGKTTGDFDVNEDNEIKVKISNDHTSDMKDVVVTVKILDVDGEDLEEDSDEYDIDAGDSEDDFEVTFDLSGEQLDEDNYDVEVTVVGEAEDGSEHESVETKNVDLDLNQHEVIIRDAKLGRSVVQCLAQTSLDVSVENIGKSNEDDVEIRVTNVALGLDLDKRNIDLDKFSGSDSDLRTSFNLAVANAAPGTYNIDVEVLRDGKLDDTQSVSLTVQDCLTQNTATQNQNQLTNAQLAAQLQAQIQAQLAQQMQVLPQVNTQPTTVSTSFRQSTGYLFLLGALAVLVFIALILAMVVMVRRK
jgi:hypothetical protein